jgi:signal transduction histidine kinase
MTETLNAWWRRAGKALALVGMALLGLVDVGFGSIFAASGSFRLPVVLLQVALAVATAAVWLPARRLGPGRLPLAALVVALWSLATTAGHIASAVGLIGERVGLRGPFWGLAESCGLLGIVFVLARLARPGPALLTIAVTGLAVAALPLRVDLGNGHRVIGMLYALLAAGAAAAGMYFRLIASDRERQLAAIRAEQRAEFARDLHDFIAHHVTGIVVQAQGARYIAEQDPQRALAVLEQIEHAGAETMTVMRRMVGVLRGHEAEPDAPLAPLALLTDVPELVRGFSEAGPVTARLHTEGRIDDLPADVTSSAYRVVMEALTNVRQHATGARQVEVWVSRTADWLLVRVTDDGRPQRAGQRPGRPGFGLAGLTERVGALAGRLRAGPGIDGGWVVDMALPLNGKGVR